MWIIDDVACTVLIYLLMRRTKNNEGVGKEIIECVHMMSRRPCWRSKQRNGGHAGGVKYSFGD